MDKSKTQAAPNLRGTVPSPSSATRKQPGAWRYRRCPVCERLMQRRNFGRASGVIVDLCREHGVWLDFEELPQIVAWVRGGGLRQADRRRSTRRKSPPADLAAARHRLHARQEINQEGQGTLSQVLSAIGDVLDAFGGFGAP